MSLIWLPNGLGGSYARVRTAVEISLIREPRGRKWVVKLNGVKISNATWLSEDKARDEALAYLEKRGMS